jgi:polygalacturonase
MSRRKHLSLWILTCLLALALPASSQAQTVFNVMNYGATGNGTTLDSPAINNAIAAAGAAGGGEILFPAGHYFCGSIHLTDNITMYLDANAFIMASKTNIDPPEVNVYSNYQDYGHSYFHDALIWGENLTNITFAGAGEITGNGNLSTGNISANQGDKALALVLCTNVVITGITITSGGHFGIIADGCSNMLVTGATILEANARDGFNLIDSSYVVVTNCNIQGSDDGMVLKSDYALGKKIGCSNVHIVNCQITSTENNALQIGSETVGNFTDISWANIGVNGSGKAGIGIVTEDGSIIDGVTYDNIRLTNCACPIFIKLCYRTSGSPNPTVGRIRNISYNNITSIHSTLFSHTNSCTIDGFSTTTNIPVENITFNNVNIATPGGLPAIAITNVPLENNSDYVPNDMGMRPSYGWYLRYANNISFTNCQVHFDTDDDRPAVIADVVTNVLFENFTADVGANDTNYDMGFVSTPGYDVISVVASANAPSPGAALRISNSGSTAASIVSPPYFSPGDGIYFGTQNVTIGSGTPGATVIYTTDGTTPSPNNGTTYTGPVALSSETVVRAMAIAPGMSNSAVNTAIYNFPGTWLFVPPPPPPPPATNFAFLAVNLPYLTNGAIAAVQNDANEPGGHWLALEAASPGAFITYPLSAIPAGTYDLQLEWKGNNDRGIISLALDGTVLGSNLDQYSSGQTYPITDYGDVTFTNTTSHTIVMTAVDKNPSSSAYWISASEFLFTLVQPPQPVISSAASPGNGVFELNGTGYPTIPYQVQMSTNLPGTNWITIGTTYADTNGVLSFTDTNATGSAQFYRFITTPSDY